MQPFISKKEYHDGFTLMEVMVSVSIFAIIITIGIGSLLTINTTLQKTRADRQAMDSLSYVMDTMTRQIRTGYEYNLKNSSDFCFKKQEVGDEVCFYIDENQTRRLSTEIDGEPYDITPPNMQINNLTFTVYETPQPYVEINVSATVTTGRQNSEISLQAGVSQRRLNSPNESSEPPTTDLPTTEPPVSSL